MKTFKTIGFILLVSVLGSCEKKETIKEKSYVFIKPYITKVTVGGFVGITEKKFNIGDIFLGKEINEGIITIQIAKHSDLNEKSSNVSYQEYLDVPVLYLELSNK